MPYIHHNSLKIHYHISGAEGPWVTLINGYTRDSSDFRPFSKYLVGKKFRVLVFDNRASGKTACNEPFSLEDIAQDVLILWQKLAIKQSHLVGFSMGGIVAQYLAIHFPHKLHKLALISTVSHPNKLKLQESSFATTYEELHKQLASYFSPSSITKNKLLIKAMTEKMLVNIKKNHLVKKSQQQRAALASYATHTEHYPQNIRCQTLIIHGDRDQVIAIEEAHNLTKVIKSSVLKILPNTGHLLLAECPQKLYQEITRFFQIPNSDSVKLDTN